MTIYDTPRLDEDGRRDEPVHVSPVRPAEDARTVLINTLSWGAVFAGILVALVVHLLLNLLGVGIGLGMLEPWSPETPPAEAVPLVAGIWWVVSGILAALAGGIVAGRLSGRPKPSTAGWHGVTAWAGTTLLIVVLIGSAIGGIIGSAVSTAGSAVGGLGQAVATALAQPGALETIQQEVSDRTAGSYDAAALQTAAVSAVGRALLADEASQGEAMDRAAEALARAQGIPVEEARTQLDELKTRYDAALAEAETEAKAFAEAAAEAGARFALYAFAALILGGLAAWLGGRLGAVEPTVTSDWRETRTL